MKRDIKIKITGVQNTNVMMEEPDTVELETTGVLYEKDSHTYIKYDEYMDDTNQPVKNLLKFDDNALQLTKKGLVNTVMLFDKDKNSTAHYITPAGPVCMSICTEDYRMQQTGQGLNIDIKYSLDYNYDYIIDCALNVSVDYLG